MSFKNKDLTRTMWRPGDFVYADCYINGERSIFFGQIEEVQKNRLIIIVTDEDNKPIGPYIALKPQDIRTIHPKDAEVLRDLDRWLSEPPPPTTAEEPDAALIGWRMR